MVHCTFTKKFYLETTLTFSFHEIFNVSGKCYFIYVTGNQGQEHHFIMKIEEETWKIVKGFPTPNWIKLLEVQLSDTIIEYQKLKISPS